VKAGIYRIDHFDRRNFLLANGRDQRRGRHEAEILFVACRLYCLCLFSRGEGIIVRSAVPAV